MEIRISSSVGSSGGGGVITGIERQQTTVTSGTDNIVITTNGGILPLDDSGVFISGPTGGVPIGSMTGGCTIDRVSVPNEIVLNAPVFMDVLFIMHFIYE